MYVMLCYIVLFSIWIIRSQIHSWFVVLFNSVQWQNRFDTARKYLDCWSPWLYAVPETAKRRIPETSYILDVLYSKSTTMLTDGHNPWNSGQDLRLNCLTGRFGVQSLKLHNRFCCANYLGQICDMHPAVIGLMKIAWFSSSFTWAKLTCPSGCLQSARFTKSCWVGTFLSTALPTEAFCEYQSCWSSGNFTSSGQGSDLRSFGGLM